MKVFSLLFFTLYIVICNNAYAQDTINWSPKYKLKYEDFKGKPDTTVIALAVCASEITYHYKIKEGKLTYTTECFFDKKKSWIKYNMPAILDHEQGHFDISKLFALKLEQKFKAYKIINPNSIYTDLQNLYNAIIRERTIMHNKYDQETKSTTSDKLQKQFIANIRKQIIALQKQINFK